MKKGRKKIKLSILIVYYSGFRNLKVLLESIVKNKVDYTYETIIVDNRKAKKVKELAGRYRSCSYIKSTGNIGYGRGNNLGAEKAAGEYLFIINPDTMFFPGTLEHLVRFLDENPDAAIAAPNLVDNDGKLFDLQGTRILTPLRALFSLTFIEKYFPDNHFYQDYYMSDIPKIEVRQADVVPGSAFVIRKKVFNEAGGFDPNFFLYFEESDLCKRVKEAGWKIYMLPNAKVMHDWSPDEGSKKLKDIFAQSRYYYFKKHFGIINALIVELFSAR